MAKENRNSLFANKNYAWGIVSGFDALCRADRNFGMQANLNQLIASRKNAEEIVLEFRQLPWLFQTQENLDKLIAMGKNARIIGTEFARLPIHLRTQRGLDRLIIKYKMHPAKF